MAVDELVSSYYLLQTPGEYGSVSVLKESLLSEPIGIGIRREDAELKDKIQKTWMGVVARMAASKKISIKFVG